MLTRRIQFINTTTMYFRTDYQQRETRDSDACVKARCEQNLSSQWCFI